MRIFNRDVGPGHPCLVVAEGGSNHGGSLDAALALTDAAADAGANSIKWQLWLSPDEMYDRNQFPEEWASADKYRLPVEWLPQLRDRAHERGMAFGLSSFGFASLDEADKWVDFHKIASIESTWADFLSAVAKMGKPILISNGASTFDESGIRWEQLGAGPVWTKTIWLGCTVAYPCVLEDVNLRSRPTFDWRWGLSDHTTHPTIAPCAAVSLGACVIEKHVRPRYECDLDGDWICGGIGHPSASHPPDFAHSLTPWKFEEMVRAIRLTEQALGSSEKRIRPSEEKYLRYRRGPRGLRGA